MTWKSLGETDVTVTPDYQFRIEEFRDAEDHQMIFVHLTVTKWTPAVFKEMLHGWKVFRKCVTCPLYAIGGVDDTDLWERFVSLIGFRFLQKVICENGQERGLFVHTIKNNKNEQQFLPEHDVQR